MATNFHGFAWALLRRYWRLLSLPVNVDELSMVDDSSAVNELSLRGGRLIWDEKKVVDNFLRSMRNGQDDDLRCRVRSFNRIIKDRFAPNGLLPYSGMISLAIELLADFSKLRSYLSTAFPVVLVDEAQDTNVLCYIFLKGLLSDESGICMFGDPIQRVYGFIGAMEGLKTRATTDLCLSQLELEHNHRFPGGVYCRGARCCDSLQHEGCHCRRYAPTSHICWRCTTRRSGCHRFEGRHSRSRK